MDELRPTEARSRGLVERVSPDAAALPATAEDLRDGVAAHAVGHRSRPGAVRESAPRYFLGQASRSGGSCVLPSEHGAHAAVKGVDEKPTSPRRAQPRWGPRTAGYGWIGDRR